MSEKTRFFLIKWKPVNDRIAYPFFKGKFRNVEFFRVYVPILCIDENDNR